MATFLLAWNPNRWKWEHLQDAAKEVKDKGFNDTTWSVGNKSVKPGDRVFMLRQGREPRGLFASGWSTSNAYEREHWDKTRQETNRPARAIDIRLDVLLDPESEPILALALLDHGVLQNMHWNTRMSGILIPQDVADALEIEWQQFLHSQGSV